MSRRTNAPGDVLAAATSTVDTTFPRAPFDLTPGSAVVIAADAFGYRGPLWTHPTSRS